MGQEAESQPFLIGLDWEGVWSKSRSWEVGEANKPLHICCSRQKPGNETRVSSSSSVERGMMNRWPRKR